MTNVIPVAGNAKAVDVSAKRLPGARWAAFLARGPSGLFAQPVTFDAGAISRCAPPRAYRQRRHRPL